MGSKPGRDRVKARESRVFVREEEPALRVAKSDGAFVYDTRGRRYIDFVMGWCVGNFGWGNAALARAAAKFKGPEYVYPGYAYEPWIELAELLSSIAPRRGMKCFRATGGSEAVDLALQAAMIHTGRRKLVSIEHSYHGNTLGTLSVGASESREKIPNLLSNCHKVEPPLDKRALGRIESLMKGREVAAFIMEPISVNLGVIAPERASMRELQSLCRTYGTMLIMDEVATGFGRTGTLFATEQFGIRPDIICLAKAITGGFGGLGATLATPAVAKSMEEDGTFYSTYGWHPRSTHVAIATIHYIIAHRQWLLGNVVRMSEHFRERISEMSFESEPELRIRGLAIGVDVHDDEYALDIDGRCQRAGLLVTTVGSTLLLLPPLNISRRVADQGLEILANCA